MTFGFISISLRLRKSLMEFSFKKKENVHCSEMTHILLAQKEHEKSLCVSTGVFALFELLSRLFRFLICASKDLTL